MRLLIFALPTVLAACASATGPAVTGENLAGDSAIIAQDAVTFETADWGSFFPYFTQNTHHLSPVLVGVAKIEAGQQIHPPHRHADEEYLMVTKGRGTWHLNGEESPANEGDILFARAWDYHGVKAAPDSPLEFVVFKYSGRVGVRPTNPNPELPAELQN